jgi:hypothetical protein
MTKGPAFQSDDGDGGGVFQDATDETGGAFESEAFL